MLETMVSMAMLAGVLATTGMIYGNVLSSDRSAQRTKAEMAVAQGMEEWEELGAGGPGELIINDCRVAIRPEAGGPGAAIVHITVRSEQGAVLLERDLIRPRP